MGKFSHSFLESDRNCSTVVELLRKASSTQPNRDAFTFLLDGETEKATLTYEELDRRSRRIAAQLQILGLSGERALLLYPAGLDYLAAFFGCLYAGVVAVPAYPPRNERNTPRIKALKADAQAAIARKQDTRSNDNRGNTVSIFYPTEEKYIYSSFIFCPTGTVVYQPANS